MLNILHTATPNPILISFGTLKIYWYGLFIVIGILIAMYIIIKFAEIYKINKTIIIDSSFNIILLGILGARLYHVFLEFPFYIKNPIQIFKIWEGGLAIHGAIIVGLFVIWRTAKKQNINFWKLTSILVLGLSLAQAIGRWGNYFNQELYGLPTSKPWGIPIDMHHRVSEYFSSTYFHPTFLYESLGNLLIFLLLLSIHLVLIKKNLISSFYSKMITLLYLILYSILRFSLEFIRIDKTPELFGLRFPQIISLLIIILSVSYIIFSLRHKFKKINTPN